jgi:lipoprotein-anchoring transpeptidase ErfK/SrfK
MSWISRAVVAGVGAVAFGVGGGSAEGQTLFALGETAYLDFSGSLPGATYYAPDSDEIYLHVSVDDRRLSVMRGDEVIRRFPVSVGKGAYLRHRNAADGGWLFETPVGIYAVGRKERDPVWYAPDWFYVEKGLPIPPTDSSRRYYPGEMGEYALYLGDGLAIHGTKDQSSVGRAVSHGCMRLTKDAISAVFSMTHVGTKVIITP